MPKHITKELKQEVIKRYTAYPITIEAVANEFGISNPSVIQILKQSNIKTWSKAELFSPNLAEDYFEEIDSHDKAYFLGLITTDGCVFRKKTKGAFVTITLAAEDKYILEEFMEAVKCNRKLVYSERDNCYTATVSSEKMVDDLEQYYVEPKSSKTQRLYKDLPKKYFADYLRGIIDGDGSYAFYSRPNRKVHRKSVRMCSGSRKFIEELSKRVHKVLDVYEPTIMDEQKNTYSITWMKNDDVETLINFIYSTDGPYLKRKKKIADKILDEIREYRDK